MSVPDRAEQLQDSNGCFGDDVVLGIVVVALHKDGSLAAIGDTIARGNIVVTGQVDPTQVRARFYRSRNSSAAPFCALWKTSAGTDWLRLNYSV